MRTSPFSSSLALKQSPLSFQVSQSPRSITLRRGSRILCMKASSSSECEEIEHEEVKSTGTMKVKSSGSYKEMLQLNTSDGHQYSLERLNDWSYYHKFFECNHCEISGLVELDAVNEKKSSLAISFTVTLALSIPVSVLVVMLHLVDAAKEIGHLLQLNND